MFKLLPFAFETSPSSLLYVGLTREFYRRFSNNNACSRRAYEQALFHDNYSPLRRRLFQNIKPKTYRLDFQRDLYTTIILESNSFNSANPGNLGCYGRGKNRASCD